MSDFHHVLLIFITCSDIHPVHYLKISPFICVSHHKANGNSSFDFTELSWTFYVGFEKFPCNQNSNPLQASLDAVCSPAYGRSRGSKDLVHLAPDTVLLEGVFMKI